MKFSRPEASLYAPARQDPVAGLDATTHLGIGAHADDLEILAFPGISACYRHPSNRFSGVIVTDGAGSPRSGSFANTSDSEMVVIRREEQHRAADLGHYASVVQLGYPSQEIKKADRSKLIADLVQILKTAQPQILYLHNPVDRHETHLAVLLACMEALKQIPENSRPREIYGCEVWCDLDWVPASRILRLPCSAAEDFGPSLLRCFASQVEGGKRYDLAAQGRRRAQATFGEAHTPDQADEVVLALDLKPLLNPGASLSKFVSSLTEEFRAEAISRVQKAEQGG